MSDRPAQYTHSAGGSMTPDEAGRTRPLEAVIDVGNIRHNVRTLKGLTPQGCRLMAVVKANAYGHGDIEVSRAALEAGADCLGVALVEEAARLRDAGFTCPVFLLFEPPPEAAARVVELELTCSVYTGELAEALSRAALESGRRTGVHLDVDTGMRRVGVYPEDAGGFTAKLAGLAGLDVQGIYTHFPVADEPEDPFTESQMDIFEAAADEAEAALGGRRLIRHAANSAGVLAFPRGHYDMVRPGIAIYGLPPSPALAGRVDLRPAMSLGGQVALVRKVRSGEGISYGLAYAPKKDSFIATIPIGYADGLSRLLTGRAEVIIGGRRRPVVGVICMDLCMVDLGDEPVPAGTPFTVIGSQGGEEISIDEIASRLGTINYEVACMVSSRVPRIHVDGDRKEVDG